LADSRDTDAARDSRSERGDAALVAQYIHELSERHGPSAGQAARSAGAGTTGAASDAGGGDATDA
jgi:hypothetical protein